MKIAVNLKRLRPAAGALFLLFLIGPLSAPAEESLKEIPVDRLIKAAENGDAPSQCELGLRYLDGKNGLEKDPILATRWIREAAAQDYAEAQYQFGRCFARGRGLEQIPSDAVQWYVKAAEQGHPKAEYALGNSYMNGFGVAKNETEGIKWIRKAAEEGLPEAQCRLAGCYLTGEGVETDASQSRPSAAASPSLSITWRCLCLLLGITCPFLGARGLPRTVFRRRRRSRRWAATWV